MNNISEDQERELKEAFQLFEKNGKVKATDLITIMRAMGLAPTEKEVQEMKDKVTKENGGFLDLPGFLNLMASKTSSMMSEYDLIEYFKVFDSGKKGFISVNEMRFVMSNLGEKMTPEELDELERDADPNSGVINYHDFAKKLLAK